jgi:hypothetical protein
MNTIKRSLRNAAFYAIGLPVFALVCFAALLMGDPTKH